MRSISKLNLSSHSQVFIQGDTSVLISYKEDKHMKYTYTMNNLSSGTEVSRKPPTNRRALEINYLSLRTIEDNLALAKNLNIVAKVLTSDGGTRTCALNGVFNLLNTTTTKYYFIAFGVVNNQIVVDMNYQQDAVSEVDVPFGIRLKDDTIEYTYLQLDGEITPSLLLEGLEKAEKEIISNYE